MKKLLIFILSLIFGLSVYSMEKFDTLSVEIPCKIKVFKADDFFVRILDKKGKPNKEVTYEVKNNVLEIKGDVLNEKDATIFIYSPIEQKIYVDKEKFQVKEIKLL